MRRVAIIGGGIAGLSCAVALAAARFSVTVFDSARVAGGRVTTKKVGLARFDLGAPFFTATNPAFLAAVESWRAFVTPYSPRWSDDSVLRPEWLFVGTPGMSAIPRELGSRTELRWSKTIERIDGSRVVSGGDVVGEFDAIVLAIPVSAARALLTASSLPIASLAHVETRRLWSVALAWTEQARANWQAGAWSGRLLELAVKESSKPSRAPGEHWVAYLSADASAELAVAEEVVEASRVELGGLIGAQGEVEARAQRWDDGAVEKPFGAPSCSVGELLLCGDWLTGGSVQDAWLSGFAVAAQLSSQ